MGTNPQFALRFCATLQMNLPSGTTQGLMNSASYLEDYVCSHIKYLHE